MKLKLIVLCGFVCLLTGCLTHSDSFVVRFWDGYYSRKAISQEYDKEEKAFYDSEPEQTKLLRKKNKDWCYSIDKKVFNEKKKKYGEQYRIKQSDIYINCMAVNGTPDYVSGRKELPWLNDKDVKRKD